MAINAGIDMAMEPYKTDYCTLMKELVEEGEIPLSRIDDACARVLRMKMRLGLFETPDTYYKIIPCLPPGSLPKRLWKLPLSRWCC